MQPNVEMSSYILFQLDIAKEDLECTLYLIDGEKYRIALNRAYYCIFHCLKALAVLYDKNFAKHSGYISFFQKEFVKTGIFAKELSKIVMDCKRLRESGDYGDMSIVSKDTAVNAYEDAQVFYEALSAYIREQLDIAY